MILITGSSGYFGSKIVRKLRGKVIGVDIHPPRYGYPKNFRLFRMDVRDPELVSLMVREGIKQVLHLAFVLNPPDLRELARDININGTRNVLECSREAGVEHIVVTTSVIAYGALPDNPVPIHEDHPRRGYMNKGYWYAEDKATQDDMVLRFVEENPDIKVAVIRPCIVFGKNVDNYISDGFFRPPFIVLPDGRDIPLQFIHEDDLADFLWIVLARRLDGVFNVAGEGYVKMSELGRIMGKKVLSLPSWFGEILLPIFKVLGIVDKRVPRALGDFFKYPWVVDTKRARDAGFVPMYTSREVFRITWEAWKSRRRAG